MGPKIHKWLVPVAMPFFGIVVAIRALDPALGHPIAHWYDRLPRDGQRLWDTTIVALAAIVLLVVLASLIERLFWRLKRNKNT